MLMRKCKRFNRKNGPCPVIPSNLSPSWHSRWYDSKHYYDDKYVVDLFHCLTKFIVPINTMCMMATLAVPGDLTNTTARFHSCVSLRSSVLVLAAIYLLGHHEVYLCLLYTEYVSG